jgi:SAM-dependent methyltransferase
MPNCRICKGELQIIMDFGKIALVGDFKKKKQNLKKHKLSLNFCKICKHVQISEIIKPNLLFKNYLWETGVSKSNINLIKDLIKKLQNYNLSKKTKILEIACNDGSFLNLIRKKFECSVLGVDPAQNLKKNLKKFKIPSIIDFFDYKLSNKIKKVYNHFNFIIARNVIAHVPNPNEIFSGVNNLLSESGIFVLEVPYLENIYKKNQYDNIFHEHIGFHSLKSIVDLSLRNNLKVFNVEKIKSQGGSLRCYICKNNFNKSINKKVDVILLSEKKTGLLSYSRLKKFRFKIQTHIIKMQKLINLLKRKKNKISIYGASGKGQALLQFCKLDFKKIDYVFDKSKLKQNCFTPGTYIKIKNPTEINKIKPDFLLLLSWNIKEEILKQEKNFIKNGGKFIIPFPSPKIL